MSKDLEETLNELGPDYRAVVARLRVGRELAASSHSSDSSCSSGGGKARGLAYLVAASLAILLAFAAVFFQSGNRTIEQSNNSSPAPREYRASVDEMIATQNPDGSWQNDFLTRRNAEALKVCGDPAARIAYKKAVRNLRSRGML